MLTASAIPWCDLATDYRPQAFRVQWASDGWMLREAAALRRQVFCTEQGLFGGRDGDDRDAIDADPSLHTLVALSVLAGEADQMVGTVRIHEASPGLWWGSRLAVRRAFRQSSALGTELIRLAVSSAHALGCREHKLIGRNHEYLIHKAFLIKKYVDLQNSI